MRPTTPFMRIGVPVLTLLIGGVGGLAIGQRQGMAWGEAMLEQEVGGVLSREVEVASCIRVSDAEHALQHLDPAIDTAVLNLSMRAGASGRALSAARLYRGVVPASGPRAEEVAAALASVPPREPPSFCPKPAGMHQPSGLSRLTAGRSK